MAEEEGDFTEESYYEEEVVEIDEYGNEHPVTSARVSSKVVTPPPRDPPSPSRPVHPLFAGGGAKNALAAAAASRENKRASQPAGEKAAPASAPASSPARPPHPLFGGGGGADKSALNDQIKMMAAKRSDRVAEGGSNVPEPAPKPKKSIDAVMPHGSKVGGSMATASLADQVAMMAARRSQRMESGEEPVISESKEPPSGPAVYPAPPKRAAEAPSRVNRNKAPAPAPEPVKKEEPKKGGGGFFGMGKKAEAPAPAQREERKPAAPAPPKESFTDLQLRKAPAASSGPASATPEFSQVQLRSTKPAQVTPPEGAPSGPTPVVTKVTTTETPAGPTTYTTTTTSSVTTSTVKRVTKHDPEYEIVDYKCVCTIL